MLADPRAEALSTRFAAQWLRLQDLDKVPRTRSCSRTSTTSTAQAMQRETELLFDDIVRHDRSVFDLFTADYTFVNERLARHYGIPNVSGDEFRKVQYPTTTRRGILGHGSVLVQTSLATARRPCCAASGCMEVLIGMPPPPPPPNIPSLEETKSGTGASRSRRGSAWRCTARTRRARPATSTWIPIGLALDNFDVTGSGAIARTAMALDTRGQMYDGTPISTPGQLTGSLLKRPIPLARSFTENLMAYALGRRIEDERPADGPRDRRGTRARAGTGSPRSCWAS